MKGSPCFLEQDILEQRFTTSSFFHRHNR